MDDLFGIALHHHRSGQLSAAEGIYRQILRVEPDNARAMHLLGLIAHQLGHNDEAVDLIGRAIACKRDEAAFHSNLGLALRAQGKTSEAIGSFRQALALAPALPEAHNNLGNALLDQGQLEDAASSFRQALALRPDFAEAHCNLGNALKCLGKLDEALSSYERGLAANPGLAELHTNLALVLQEKGRLQEAVASHRRALLLAPTYAEAHNNLGIALKEQGRIDEAIACYRQALAVKRDYLDALSNLATALQEQGRIEEAATSYRDALALRPEHMAVRSNLLFALNCAGRPSPALLEEARHYGRAAQEKVGVAFSSWHCSPRPERLRVGFVSGDLWSHPVAFFLESVIAHLDPERVEVVGYPTEPRADALTARLRAKCAAWQPLFGLSDEAAAQLIHAGGAHLLVDLAGHTARNRLPLFAWKPAPVQVSWLGYFATTGLAEMDYLLADPHVVPPGEEARFTERVWRLPESYRCFTPPDVALEPGPLPCLSSGAVTFGCFNNLAKMTDEVVALWARVLHAVPGSRLFLKANQLNEPTAAERVRTRFGAEGVAAERLILEGQSPRAEMLAAYRRVDILLDPFPYPGGTTSMEALWMGVPCVTRRGETMLSRGGESIAHNTGLADWIAGSDEDYVAKAAAAAADPHQLTALRARLRQQVLASPMCDAQRFARNLEAAFQAMWTGAFDRGRA